jgi:cyclopropane fatty-acyl-phospholipid synthase-like methyltransferase
MSVWNERYAGEEYFYGTEPNAFLVSQKPLLKSDMSCLAVADGEGRNGAWLAEQGLDVLSLDASPVAQAKAQRLAQTRGVAMRFEQADLLSWRSDERFDVIAAIFIQFVGPELRPAQFENLKRHLKPGGLLLLQGYTPRQLEFKTGGPSQLENLYTEAMLRELCADMQVIHMCEHDSVIHEGAGHSGMSALIDLVARAG